jgi:hypothetical protein
MRYILWLVSTLYFWLGVSLIIVLITGVALGLKLVSSVAPSARHELKRLIRRGKHDEAAAMLPDGGGQCWHWFLFWKRLLSWLLAALLLLAAIIFLLMVVFGIKR